MKKSEVALKVFAVVVVIALGFSARLFYNLFETNRENEVKIQVFGETQALTDMIIREVENSKIDYEEYYSRNVLGADDYGQNQGVYEVAFLENEGILPALCESDCSGYQTELYLVNNDGEKIVFLFENGVVSMMTDGIVESVTPTGIEVSDISFFISPSYDPYLLTEENYQDRTAPFVIVVITAASTDIPGWTLTSQGSSPTSFQPL